MIAELRLYKNNNNKKCGGQNSLPYDLSTLMLFSFHCFLVEKRPGVCDVALEEKLPVEKHVLTSWEQVSKTTLNQ